MKDFFKNFLYRIKLMVQSIFYYPQYTINPCESLDYDEYWKEKRGDDIGVLSVWQKDRARIILKQIKNLDKEVPITIGDIGCGDGSILKFLLDRLEKGKGIGYDNSLFVLDKAKRIGVDTVQLDINKESEYSIIQPADYILLLEVLEHIAHTEILLSAAYQKTSKGVFFSVPNSGYFIYRLRLLFGKFPVQWRVHPSEHLRFWTTKDMQWWLHAQGYQDYNITHYRGVPLLNKFLPKLFAAGLVVLVQKS